MLHKRSNSLAMHLLFQYHDQFWIESILFLYHWCDCRQMTIEQRNNKTIQCSSVTKRTHFYHEKNKDFIAIQTKKMRLILFSGLFIILLYKFLSIHILILLFNPKCVYIQTLHGKHHWMRSFGQTSKSWNICQTYTRCTSVSQSNDLNDWNGKYVDQINAKSPTHKCVKININVVKCFRSFELWR